MVAKAIGDGFGVWQRAVACSSVWQCAEESGAATASGSPPLVVVVVGGWRGWRRRIALFCDELTNFGWLTLSVLKYLMKINKFIRESA
jgi:hypothetical protein